MFPHVLTVDIATGLSLIYETVLTSGMRERVELFSGFMLRCASITRVQPLGQLWLYTRLYDLIVPFYFAAMKQFPTKLLIGTTCCDRHIEKITPATKQIVPRNARPLPVIAFNDDTISVIHTPQPFTAQHTIKENFTFRLSNSVDIEPFSQRLAYVSAPVIGLFTIENHPHLYNSRSCLLTNGIVQVIDDKKFYVWILNMSDKSKKLPRNARVGIVTTAPSDIYHLTSSKEEVGPKGKESMEDNPLDLKTQHPLTVDTLATFNGMRIRDPTKSLSNAMDKRYQTKEKHYKEAETDWKDRINVSKSFEKYKPQLIKRLEKFSSM